MAAKQQRSTLVGVFEDRMQADRAVAELKKAGFRDDQIGVAMRHGDTARIEAVGEEVTEETHVEEGATTGLVAGLGLGALAGLGVLSGVIPVIGPAIAGGTLGIILSNAAAGAAVAGLAGALIGYGIPEDEARYYHEEFEAGRAIVTVQAESRYDEALAILRRHGAYDVDTRMAAAAPGAAYATDASTRAASKASRQAGDTVEVVEEHLHASKTPVEAGEVRVRKEVRTETENLQVPVTREEVVIERHPVNRKATGAEATMAAGDELRIPVREERVNVTKDAVVTEEVRVGKRVVEDVENVAGQVRKEDVRIERTGDVDVRDRKSR